MATFMAMWERGCERKTLSAPQSKAWDAKCERQLSKKTVMAISTSMLIRHQEHIELM